MDNQFMSSNDYDERRENYFRQQCKVMAPKLKTLCACTIIGFVLAVIAILSGIILGVASVFIGPSAEGILNALIILFLIISTVNAIIYGVSVIMMKEYDERFLLAGIMYIIYEISNSLKQVFDNGFVKLFAFVGSILGLIFVANFAAAMNECLLGINNRLAESWDLFKKIYIITLIASGVCLVIAFIPGIRGLGALGLFLAGLAFLVIGIWQIVLLFQSASAMSKYN